VLGVALYRFGHPSRRSKPGLFSVVAYVQLYCCRQLVIVSAWFIGCSVYLLGAFGLTNGRVARFAVLTPFCMRWWVPIREHILGYVYTRAPISWHYFLVASISSTTIVWNTKLKDRKQRPEGVNRSRKFLSKIIGYCPKITTKSTNKTLWCPRPNLWVDVP
jgi:hypothetical protein